MNTLYTYPLYIVALQYVTRLRILNILKYACPRRPCSASIRPKSPPGSSAGIRPAPKAGRVVRARGGSPDYKSTYTILRYRGTRTSSYFNDAPNVISYPGIRTRLSYHTGPSRTQALIVLVSCTTNVVCIHISRGTRYRYVLPVQVP